MAKWQWGEMAKGKMTKGKMGKGEMANIGGEMAKGEMGINLMIHEWGTQSNIQVFLMCRHVDGNYFYCFIFFRY
jgi:hypothetical protein